MIVYGKLLEKYSKSSRCCHVLSNDLGQQHLDSILKRLPSDHRLNLPSIEFHLHSVCDLSVSLCRAYYLKANLLLLFDASALLSLNALVIGFSF